MAKELHSVGTPNGDSVPKPTTNGTKSKLNDLVEAAKSATLTVTNGVNGVKV